jgi:PPOX class probable F420-dependent enzyme
MAALSDPLVQELLNGRFIATLATHNSDGTIHLTSVWYMFADGQLYIATSSRTRKLRNVLENPTASLMVDSRDVAASRGVTCAGAAEIVSGSASSVLNARIHRRYLSDAALADARVGPVFAGWDDVTIRVSPESIFTWDMRELDRNVLGGAMMTPGYFLPLER